MKIKSIHFFRGIAILFIIAGHCLGHSLDIMNLKIENQTIINKLLYNFITGGTGMFVFISGFLFHSVFYKKYEYKSFVIKKFINIYVPYIILSLYPVLNMFFIAGNYNEFGFTNNTTDIIKTMYTGLHMTGYWYITFIMIVFLLSPLFIKFIQTKYKLSILITSFIVSIVIHRPAENLNQLHSVVYFTFFYLLGIWLSINKEKALKYLKNKEILISFMVIGVIVIQTIFIGKYGNYHKGFFELNGIDFILIQKLLLCLLFFTLLTRYEERKMIILDKLAEYSFAIYFIHPYVLRIFKNKIYPKIIGTNYWIVFMAETVIAVLVSILVAIIIKKILKKYSRYIIGY